MSNTTAKILVGVCMLVCSTALSAGNAKPFTNLYSFPANGKVGAGPDGQLTLGPDGNFYGATRTGGPNNGRGTVFKVTPQGQLTTLYTFAGKPDGDSPFGALLFDADGNLYGTTSAGGTIGGGTVYKLAPDGTETILHSFGASGDGANPYTGLTADGSGNFYGVTSYGGASYGTIFSITPSGQESVLHSFDNTNGYNPQGRLLRDQDGTLYGTTTFGGKTNQGVVFKFTTGGTFSVLHSFGGKSAGIKPTAGLIFGRAGEMYGTTPNGGVNNKYGSVYSINRNGKESVVYTFSKTTGATPQCDLVVDAKGLLYGTTQLGGTKYIAGTVFKLNPNTGEETLLHSFKGRDGSQPISGLSFDASGLLYGVTTGASSGVDLTGGTIFEIAP